MNCIFHGLFEDLVHKVADQSVDLVVTSPPYANQRKAFYGGVDEAEYPAWTVGWMTNVRRILKPSGSVIVNIRPHVQDGEISDYMLHTRLAVRASGWIECDEWIWHKPDAPPLGHNMRPRRAWESLHWFALNKNPFCDPKAIGARSRKIGFSAKKGDGQQFHGNSNAKDGIARVTDVMSAGMYELHRADYNNHPAQFPESLVEQIIETLAPKRGVVLDPFIGGGTTAVAALKTGRSYIGFEKEAEFVKVAERRIEDYNSRIDNESDEFFFAEDGGTFY